MTLILALFLVSQICLAGKNKELRYLKPVFDKVSTQSNIEYGEVKSSEGKDVKLLLDVYSPDGDKEKNRPAVLLIHGGGFLPQNNKTKYSNLFLAKEFATRGFVVFANDFRLRNNPNEDFQAMLKDAVNDCMLSLDWIRKNSAKFGIDQNQIIVSGSSSGGIIAANVCYLDQGENSLWDKSGIIALADFWGSPKNDELLGPIDKNDPPTVLVQGTKDTILSFDRSTNLLEELKSNGIPCTLYPVEEVDHNDMLNHFNEYADTVFQFLYKFIHLE
jgi:acetyl esterase/lipase